MLRCLRRTGCFVFWLRRLSPSRQHSQPVQCVLGGLPRPPTPPLESYWPPPSEEMRVGTFLVLMQPVTWM